MPDLTHNGTTLTAEEWARRWREFNLPKMNASTICKRKRDGWSDEKALTTPPASKRAAGRKAAKVSPWGSQFTINANSRERAKQSGFS